MTALATLVKDTHGLIGTSKLHLQEVRLSITALRTHRHGTIHILPGGGTTQNVIHLFSLGERFLCDSRHNLARIGTGCAVKNRLVS